MDGGEGEKERDMLCVCVCALLGLCDLKRVNIDINDVCRVVKPCRFRAKSKARGGGGQQNVYTTDQ